MSKAKTVVLVMVDVLSVLCILAGAVLLGYKDIIMTFDVVPLAGTLIGVLAIIAVIMSIVMPISSI